MPRYSEERKTAVLKKLLSPEHHSVIEVAAEEGISGATLYGWLKTCRQHEAPVPGSRKTGDDWSADAKLAVFIATAPLSETKFGAYCRAEGLYPEQVQRWKGACLQGAGQQVDQDNAVQRQQRDDRRTIKKLKTEAHRKDRGLAETTSLLVLSKSSRPCTEKPRTTRATDVVKRTYKTIEGLRRRGGGWRRSAQGS